MENVQTNPNEATVATNAPQIEQKAPQPKGILPKGMQAYIYLGVAVVFILATFISSQTKHKQPNAKQVAAIPPPLLTADDTKIEEFDKQLRKQQASAAGSGYAPTPNTGAYGAAVPPGTPSEGQPPDPPYSANGQPPDGMTPQAGNGSGQRDPLVDQEREMTYKSRFASNLAYSQSRGILAPGHNPESNFVTASQSSSVTPALPPYGNNPLLSAQPAMPTPSQTPYAMGRPLASGQPQPSVAQQKSAEVHVDSAIGQPYVHFEGTVIETALMNRIDGDAPGPVNVLVTNPVYSHDLQHVLIPDGTVVLGESKKIGSVGFGQQRRIAIVFHRMIMPDGFSVDLDKFNGLDQIGEEGVKDKVNNHYLQIFGASIALGSISGAAEATNGNAGLYMTGPEAYQAGVASSLSQSGADILNQFLNIPPTITIREGHRIKVYISQDLLLPAVENHTMPPNL